MKDLQKAVELLTDERTCVLVKDDTVYISEEKGIAPVMYYLNNGIDISGFSVADRIVGKAAASLFVCAGIKEVYGEVMSEKGKAKLEEYGIPCSYGRLVEKIINRRGDDICPMDKTVLNIDDPHEAYKALYDKTKPH